jgi:mannose-1-phosphate guanylyltransferase
MNNIILAGGSGTRFWPVSRRERPKQLVELWGDQTMIEATVDRLRTASPEGRVVVVCGDHLTDPTREALAGVSDVDFLVEPEARDTLPAIVLAAIQVLETDGDVPTGVFPADHYVGDTGAFAECVAAAERQAENGHIVTMGIEPTRPETGYGYIHFDDNTAFAPKSGELEAHPVEEFVEKPDRELAQRYLASGDYLWNSGIFCFKPSVLLGEVERQLPEMYEQVERMREAWDSDDRDEVIDEAFGEMQAISIDYGVMENAEDVVVVPATYSWSDVGHWAAVDEVRETDEQGNVVEADAELIDTTESVVYSEDTDRLLAAIDLDEMIVVDTDDALLVAPKSSAQKVRDLVDRLEDTGRDDLL